MKTVMCFGTFDILHPGHLNYFEQARQHGDYLMVVVARDETKRRQQKPALFSEQQRLSQVQQQPLVDEAVLGYHDDHLQIIGEKQPDILCLGYDQQVNETELSRRLAQRGLFPQIRRLRPYRPEVYKSSLLKKELVLPTQP